MDNETDKIASTNDFAFLTSMMLPDQNHTSFYLE